VLLDDDAQLVVLNLMHLKRQANINGAIVSKSESLSDKVEILPQGTGYHPQLAAETWAYWMAMEAKPAANKNGVCVGKWACFG
jgi:hypothetical protein